MYDNLVSFPNCPVHVLENVRGGELLDPTSGQGRQGIASRLLASVRRFFAQTTAGDAGRLPACCTLVRCAAHKTAAPTTAIEVPRRDELPGESPPTLRSVVARGRHKGITQVQATQRGELPHRLGMRHRWMSLWRGRDSSNSLLLLFGSSRSQWGISPEIPPSVSGPAR